MVKAREVVRATTLEESRLRCGGKAGRHEVPRDERAYLAQSWLRGVGLEVVPWSIEHDAGPHTSRQRCLVVIGVERHLAGQIHACCHNLDFTLPSNDMSNPNAMEVMRVFQVPRTNAVLDVDVAGQKLEGIGEPLA